VNLHRGSISVRSEVGEGSTFTVTLPAIEPKAEPTGEEAAAAEPTPEPEPATEPEVTVGG
jgi:hypothetical protein